MKGPNVFMRQAFHKPPEMPKITVDQLLKNISSYGNTPRIKVEDLAKEVELIHKKQSNLSAKQRAAVLRVYELYKKQKEGK